VENALSGALPGIPSRSVDVSALDRELSQLLRPAKDAADSSQPVTRACMSNLIVVAGKESAPSISNELATIAERHPSRVLLLLADPEAGEQIRAAVSALCYRTGGGRQICSEHVEVAAAPSERRRLPSIVRPLLIGDLPTTLWWNAAQAPPLGGEVFDELAAMADRVIYDSLGWPDPARNVIATADWALREGSAACDLAWGRLEPWRRLLAESLDPALRPGALEALHSVDVEHGPHALPKAWLLVGWLARCLGWRTRGGSVEPGVAVRWSFEARDGPVAVTVRRIPDAPSELRAVSIGSRSSRGPSSVRFRSLGSGRLGVQEEPADGPERVLPALEAARASLLASELSERGIDPFFREALAVSRVMAKELLQ
jgi:glucose-6-phosphate dehydrogenase assembly protein OpcA